jgi:hypothetical protein
VSGILKNYVKRGRLFFSQPCPALISNRNRASECQASINHLKQKLPLITISSHSWFSTTRIMSAPRLTFLYPHLFRAIKVSEPLSQNIRLRTKPAQQSDLRTRNFTTTKCRRDRLVERHGKAVEPFLVEGETAEGLKVFSPEDEGNDKEKSKEFKQKIEASGQQAIQNEAQKKEGNLSSDTPLSKETEAAANLLGDPGQEANDGKGESAKANGLTPRQQAAANTADSLAPLETVLQMPPPETQAQENESKPPHLQTPPYVHHFDTYTLVQQVEAGGFKTDQSITAMKAVRGLLAENLDIAKAGLVSKSDVENVS